MDFFRHQAQARRYSKWLIVLFMLAVLSLLAITQVFLFFFPWQMHDASFVDAGSNRSLSCLLAAGCDFWQHFHWRRALFFSAVIIVGIGGASWLKWHELKVGGKQVAKLLGGRLVAGNSDNLAERRLLNVAEEMAVASGIPMPQVYILNEQGINACAAGFNTQDAMIAVTQGCLDHFNRDQLQAVVAHEFSHILNGDMRLNMYCTAWLHGIMCISEAGKVFLHSGHRHSRNRSTPVFFLGVGLLAIGYLGVFFAGLIKSGLNRQREYLADAQAAQLTRYPKALAEALTIVAANSHKGIVTHAKASQFSHLFFAQAVSGFFDWNATHPPIAERISRLHAHTASQSVDEVIKPVVNAAAKRMQKAAADKVRQQLKEQQISTMVAAIAMQSQMLKQGLETGDKSAKLHEPLFAAASVASLFLAHEPDIRQKQLSGAQHYWPELIESIRHKQYLLVEDNESLALVELAVTALRQLQPQQYQYLKHVLVSIMAAMPDRSLLHWSLYQLLVETLDSFFGAAKLCYVKYEKITQVADEVLLILSLWISNTGQSSTQQQEAFLKACQVIGLPDQKMPATKLDMAKFHKACQQLKFCHEQLKANILYAMFEAAKLDGKIELIEKNILHAMAATLQVPLPNISDN